jgi:phosphatidate phosphatase APP1
MYDMKNKKYLVLAVILGFNLFCAASSTVKEDEEVIFFPTVAHPEKESGQWVLPIHGWIFEPEKDSILRNALLEGLTKVSEKFFKEKGDFDKKRFEDRLRMFIVDNERNKRITISVQGPTFTMKPSKPNGHFYGEVKIPASDLKGSVKYHALGVKGDRQFEGVGYLLEPGGVSVISDIDDTIKNSQMLDKKKAVEKTFFEEFEAIPGMSEAYNTWHEQGASFHYVSSTPWQLYPFLWEFLKAAKFPAGSFHLKLIRLIDASVLNFFKSPVETKVPIIKTLINRFPKRKFILVGDSGEHDPEVYGIIGRQFPGNLLHIYIRDVTPDVDKTGRFQEAFKGISGDKWTIFTDPAVLKRIKLELSSLCSQLE